MNRFQNEALSCASDINKALDEALSIRRLSGVGEAPERLVLAMRHGTLNGGKRLRPLLLRQAAAIFNVPSAATIIAGMAVEMVHCYSLIHDDLPSMDNDDLRRGQKTVHKQFDEATAILAGDNLLTLAFELLSSDNYYKDTELRLKLISELAQGAGAGGMVGGQMRDLEGENNLFSENEISVIQNMKTGALIRSSVRMGALIGDANEQEILALTRFAELAGEAFQLSDDILDETASEQQMGKATKKDVKSGKPTLIAQIGIGAGKARLAKIIDEAISALSKFGKKADSLRLTAKYFGERKS